ncbi:MAG: Calx-beta domain-containing protein [Leptolyngbyaceae cyanobacterium]
MSFKIEFDYSLAPEGAFDTLAKQRLEEAARMWEWFIDDEFPDIPAGTQLNVYDPATFDIVSVTLDQPIDDLRIYVGATSDLPATTGARAYTSSGLTTGSLSDGRFNGSDYQPWVGSIVFNTKLDKNFANIPLAIHEIGHILGIALNVPAFSALASDGFFDGENALAVNNGNPIPLDGSHIQDGLAINGQVTVLGSGDLGDGLPSLAELAILADIGYQVPVLQGDYIPLNLDYYRKGTDGGDFLRTLGGNDFLDARGGDDRLTGGGGKDTFFFTLSSGNDTINDFTVADDIIQISESYDFTSTSDLVTRVKLKETIRQDLIQSELTLSSTHVITLYHDAPLTDSNFLISDETPPPFKNHTPETPEEDPAPVITASFASTSQSGSEAGEDLSITVQLNQATTADVIIPFTLGGTATVGTEVDYTITTSPLTITAGQTEATITITPLADNDTDPDETIVVTLGEPTNAVLGTDMVHTVTITDVPTIQDSPDDPEPELYPHGIGDGTLMGDALGTPLILGSVGGPTLKIEGKNGGRLGGTQEGDRLIGKRGDDILIGKNGNDLIIGKKGNDILKGGKDNDYLRGNAGSDRLLGQKGDTLLEGGKGDDVIIAGRGKDMIMFKNLAQDGTDIIKRFDVGEDVMDLSQVLQNYFGDEDLLKLKSYVLLNSVGSRTEILVDLDGNGAGTDAATVAVLENVTKTSLTATNFVL